MKSIKEASVAYGREHNGTVNIEDFEAGANYVLEIIEHSLTPQKCLTDIGINISPEALIKTALQTIEQLKK